MSSLSIKPESYPIKTANDLPVPDSSANLPSMLQGTIFDKIFSELIHEEYSDMLFSIFKYLETFVPNQIDYVNILTEEEINSIFTSVAAIIGYRPNYQFLAKWSESFSGAGFRNLRKELESRIFDLYTIAIRRKYYGSYAGYKMLFSTSFRHGSVYIVGNYGIKSFNQNYDRKFRLVNYEKSVLKFLPYSNTIPTAYPKTGYLEGYTDSIFYPARFLKYDTGLKYDETALNDSTKYTLQYDITQPVYYDNTIFLEMTLDRTLKHRNYFNGTLCLQDIPWLDFIETQVPEAKRISDKIRIGSQMNIVVDTSGFYTKIDSPYTHPDTQVKAFVFRSNYLANKDIVKIQLGTGGESKKPWFKSIVDVAPVPLFGESSLYENTLYVDDSQLTNSTVEVDTQNITPGLERPIFESPIGILEQEENVAGDFHYINAAVYCQEIKDALDLNTNLVVSPIIKDIIKIDGFTNTATINVGLLEDTVNDNEIDNKSLNRILKICNYRDLPRNKITPGSLNIQFILKPNLQIASQKINRVEIYDSSGTLVEVQYKVGSTKLDILNVEAFEKQFWIMNSIEEVNPFWQYLVISDEFDKTLNVWRQVAHVYKKRKIVTPLGEYYGMEDITNTEQAYVRVYPGLTYTYNPIAPDPSDVRIVSMNENFVNYSTGEISFVLFNNLSSLNVEDEYLPLRTSMEVKHEYWYTFNETGFATSYSIRQPDLTFDSDINRNFFANFEEKRITDLDSAIAIPKVLSSIKYNYYVNTTKNISDASDTKSAIVSITEMALFNSDGNIVLYANFPPVIYNSFKHHLSFNIFIKNSPILVITN